MPNQLRLSCLDRNIPNRHSVHFLLLPTIKFNQFSKKYVHHKPAANGPPNRDQILLIRSQFVFNLFTGAREEEKKNRKSCWENKLRSGKSDACALRKKRSSES